MPARSVDLVFADPPYNLQLNGELWRPNMTLVDAADDHWDQFDQGSEDPQVSFAYYDAFTKAWLTAVRRVMKDSATLWVIGSYHNIYRVGAILMDMGFWILNDIVWIKSNPMPQMKGVRFCNAHETLLWVKKTKEQTRYTFPYKDLKGGNEDRQVRSDWYIPLCTGAERMTVNGQKAHTTQKPEALLHRVIASSSCPGDLVLDPFCGTGTTAAVAKRLNRRFVTINSDETYIQVARERVESVVPSPRPEETLSLDAPPKRVPFATLVERGLLAVGSKLWLKAGGKSAAVVNEDGTISANGFRGSIHKVGAKCLNLPACNGWTAWLYENPGDGRLILIDELRGQFHASVEAGLDASSPASKSPAATGTESVSAD